jgi:hypothetical protein
VSGQEPGRQPGEQYLMALRSELARRGVTCNLRESGSPPQLPVWYRGASNVDEPLDNVVVTFIRGQCWYSWPEITPISPVVPVSQAAEAIIDELLLGDEAGKVADLTALRMTRPAPPDTFGADALSPAPAGVTGSDDGLQVSLADTAPLAGPASQGSPRSQEMRETGPEQVLPGGALDGLRVELAAWCVATTGMTVTRMEGTLAIAGRPGVGYRFGWLFWLAGRLSAGGRPMYAVHRAGDPAGVARRLALRQPQDD